MTRRSDALQALAAEVVDLEGDVARAREAEEAARQEFVAARQALDAETQQRSALEDRLKSTERALEIIANRDSISDETVRVLKARATR